MADNQNSDTIIRVEGIHKAFGSKRVLTGVDFDVRRGEVLVVIGKSGSGKSVIFKHLTALLRPDQGAIYIDNVNICPLNDHQLNPIRRKFGVAFQMSALFDSLTIYENVAFSLLRETGKKRKPKEEIDELVREKLALVGLRGVENRKPAELSGGMQKRVAIARAIALNPDIILYDEPTTGLDPMTAAVIDDLIMRLNHELGITSIVVSHDMASVFKIADRITMLYEGEMILTGSPDIFRDPEDPVVRQFIAGEQEGPFIWN